MHKYYAKIKELKNIYKLELEVYLGFNIKIDIIGKIVNIEINEEYKHKEKEKIIITFINSWLAEKTKGTYYIGIDSGDQMNTSIIQDKNGRWLLDIFVYHTDPMFLPSLSNALVNKGYAKFIKS